MDSSLRFVPGDPAAVEVAPSKTGASKAWQRCQVRPSSSPCRPLPPSLLLCDSLSLGMQAQECFEADTRGGAGGGRRRPERGADGADHQVQQGHPLLQVHHHHTAPRSLQKYAAAPPQEKS
eukprot:2854375-Rhodomonas_salina.1